MSWENKFFIDFILLQRGHDLTKEQIKPGIYPVVTSTSIMGYHNAFKAEGPGVVTGRSGTIGEVQYIEENYWPHNTSLYVKDFKGNNPKFVYFFLKNFGTAQAKSGSAVPTLNRNNLSKIPVRIPDVGTQQRIASILSAYNDLIENNRRQIKLLEEAAQRLYKEWFVDLRFPDWETTPITDGVPEGWIICTAGDVIDFNPKTPLTKGRIKQSVPMSALSTSSMVLNSSEFTMTESNSGAKFRNRDTLLARITPCLENGKTAFVAGITSEEGAVGSTEFIVMRAKEINPYMVYLLARTEEFRKTAINSMTGSDGRQRAQVDKIMQFPYLLAPQSILEAFSLLIEPIFEQVYLKNSQIAWLSQARDRLLPKLMSGELGV